MWPSLLNQLKMNSIASLFGDTAGITGMSLSLLLSLAYSAVQISFSAKLTPYGLRGCNAHVLLILALYKTFACLVHFPAYFVEVSFLLIYFLTYLFF